MPSSVFNVLINGQSLDSFGFVAFNHPNGLSLNTFGFLTPCDAIWDTANETISTTWIDCPNPNATLETCED